MVLPKTLLAEAADVCIPKVFTFNRFCMQEIGMSATLKL